MTVMPSRPPISCMRQRSASVTVSSASTTAGSGTPSSVDAAMAASAFITWCSPRTPNRTGADSPVASCTVKSVPRACAERSTARTSASGPSPNHTTRAAVRPAIGTTRGSSALSTATSVSSRSVTISDLALTVCSMPPNSPAWARPTFSTMPTSGRAIRTSRAISPTPDAPISATRNRVSAASSSIVTGAPTSLLNEARAATVGPTRSSTARSRFFVVVLPFDPVTPTMRRSPAARTRATTSVASAPSASTVSATTTCGTARSSTCSTTSRAAPCCAAIGANRWPSSNSPRLAKNTSPGAISRESVVTAPATTVSAAASVPSRCSVPPTAEAISARVSAIMRPSPPRAVPASRRLWLSTGSSRPSPRGSPRGRVRRRGSRRPRPRARAPP